MKIAKYRITVKIVLVVTILAICFLVLDAQRHRPAYPPVFSSGVINKNIVELAKIKNPKTRLPPVSSLPEWNAYLQKNFLRPANIDHQDMAHMRPNPKHAQMLPLFNALGMVKDIYPAHRNYDHIFVFGGTPSNTKERFEFLAQNIASKKIYVPDNATITYINGHRKIDKSEVAEAKAMGVDCEYQHQCAELIWHAHYAGLPLKLEIFTIEAPEGRRANTDDTLMAFFARIPAHEKTRLLGYSNQPYGPYQGDTANAVKNKMKRFDLEIDVAAKESTHEVATIVYLDSLARRVYIANSEAPKHK